MVSKFSSFGQQRETLLFPAAVTFCFQILWKEYFTKPTVFPEVYKLINISPPSKPFSISQMSVLDISLLLKHLGFIRLPALDVPAQLSQELVMSFLLGRPGRGWWGGLCPSPQIPGHTREPRQFIAGGLCSLLGCSKCCLQEL